MEDPGFFRRGWRGKLPLKPHGNERKRPRNGTRTLLLAKVALLKASWLRVNYAWHLHLYVACYITHVFARNFIENLKPFHVYWKETKDSIHTRAHSWQNFSDSLIFSRAVKQLCSLNGKKKLEISHFLQVLYNLEGSDWFRSQVTWHEMRFCESLCYGHHIFLIRNYGHHKIFFWGL